MKGKEKIMKKGIIGILLLCASLTLMGFEFIDDLHWASLNIDCTSKGSITYMLDRVGITVWDYSDPLSPELVAVVREPDYYSAKVHLFITEDILWKSQNRTICAYDITAPANPVEIFKFDLNLPVSEIYNIQMFNNNLVISTKDCGYTTASHLKVYFYDYASLPNLIQIHDTFEACTSAIMMDNNLYYIKLTEGDTSTKKLCRMSINSDNNFIFEGEIDDHEFNNFSDRLFLFAQSDNLFLLNIESIKSYEIIDGGFTQLDSLSIPRIYEDNAKSFFDNDKIYLPTCFYVDILNPSQLSLNEVVTGLGKQRSIFSHEEYLYYGGKDGIYCVDVSDNENVEIIYHEPKVGHISVPILQDNLLYMNVETGYYTYDLSNLPSVESVGYTLYDEENYPFSLNNLPASFLDCGEVLAMYLDNGEFGHVNPPYDLAFINKSSFPELDVIATFPNLDQKTDLVIEGDYIYGIFHSDNEGHHPLTSFIVFDTSNGNVEIVGITDISSESSFDLAYALMKTDNYITFINHDGVSGEYTVNAYRLLEDFTIEHDTTLDTYENSNGVIFVNNSPYLYYSQVDVWQGRGWLKVLDMLNPEMPIIHELETYSYIHSMVIHDNILYTNQHPVNGSPELTIVYSLENPVSPVEIYRSYEPEVHHAFALFIDDFMISVYGGICSMYRLPTITNVNDFDMELIDSIKLTNYPNPFNPETTISYDVSQEGSVTVDIYNLKGQKVKSLINENKEAGTHSIIWRGDNNQGKQVSSGTYFYRVKNGEQEVVKKMMLLK